MKAINLNDKIKVKLNPKGVDIFYHRYDHLITDTGFPNCRMMPKIDKYGFTEFQLWDFMNLYGQYMILGAPKVISDLNIYTGGR